MDFEAITSHVAQEVLNMSPADGAIVEMLEGDELVYLAASGTASPTVGLRLQLESSLSGACILEARMLQCDDARTDQRVNREACEKVGVRSMIVNPLFHEGNAVGVLKVFSAGPSAFGWRDRLVLEYLSELIAASIYTASRYSQDALFRKATRDHLTGLANRALFHDRLRHAMEQAGRYKSHVAVLSVDMDGLKSLNDQHGHQAGDVALRTLASRLSAAARKSDTVARLGGDEFAVVLSPVEGRRAAQQIQVRMKRMLDEPLVIAGESHALSASFGLALYPDDGVGLEELLNVADRAMYRAKRERYSQLGTGSSGNPGAR